MPAIKGLIKILQDFKNSLIVVRRVDDLLASKFEFRVVCDVIYVYFVALTNLSAFCELLNIPLRCDSTGGNNLIINAFLV